MQVWQAEQNNRIPSIRPLTAPCAYSQRSFLPQIKNESTTHDEEENAAGRQAKRRKSAAFIEKLQICMKALVEKTSDRMI